MSGASWSKSTLLLLVFPNSTSMDRAYTLVLAAEDREGPNTHDRAEHLMEESFQLDDMIATRRPSGFCWCLPRLGASFGSTWLHCVSLQLSCCSSGTGRGRSVLDGPLFEAEFRDGNDS